MENATLILALDGPRVRPVTATGRDAPPLVLTMGLKTELTIRLVDRQGYASDPFPLPAPGGADPVFRLAFAQDFDPETPVLFATDAVTRTGEGQFSATLDNTRTAEMVEALGGASFRELGVELLCAEDGDTWDNPSGCIQFRAVMRNRMDAGDTPVPAPGKTFLTNENVGEYAATPAQLEAVETQVEAVREMVDSLAESDPVFAGWKGGAALAAGENAEAVATPAVAVGAESKATAEKSVAVGTGGVAASGEGAVAIGATAVDAPYSATSASGINAVAVGAGANAEGNKALAAGYAASASAPWSLALGTNSLCKGTQSAALGSGAKVQRGTGSVAIGAGATVGSNEKSVDGACQIGAGTNMESGTIQFRDKRLVTADEIAGFLSSESDPVFAAWKDGTRLAAGQGAVVQGSGGIGIAIGNGADCWQGVAVGSGTKALMDSTALGVNASASAAYATALGADATAPAQYTVAVGCNASAGTSQYGTAVGGNAKATGDRSTALGYGAKATGALSVAIGVDVSAPHMGSIVIGSGGSGGSIQAVSSHGVGTFNVNPTGGAEGFYVGDSTLKAIIESIVDARIASFSNAGAE